MKRIVEIVPARPGWYARWRPTAQATRSCPVAVWVLVEEEGANREVIGIDSDGRWPGADGDQADAEFVRYLFQPPESGQPEDATGPVPTAVERIPTASWL